MYEGRPFRYHTNCINSKAKFIHPMTEQARQIEWATFIQHVPVEEVRDIFAWYEYHGQGLHIKDDWSVGFYKSRYRGKVCYYIDHSRIEYIWTIGGC